MRYGRPTRPRHLEGLGSQFSIPIDRDEDDYLGRECPKCEAYFKITPGTGITEGDPPCHCPYCGHQAGQDEFFTTEQIEYAKSVVINKVTGAFTKDLKSLEFDIKPKGMFGIGMSMRVKGRPQPVQYYREKRLETEVVCDECTLRYAIYGVFAFCPDCRTHNSRQILEKNLELASKQIDLAGQVDAEMATHLVADALENAVSSFDGFGRAVCDAHANKATDPARARRMSFQNISGANGNLSLLFGFDLASSYGPEDWQAICRGFQKRHLLAHTMGVVDESYLRATSDPQAIVGRKVSIESDEVRSLLELLKRLGRSLAERLETNGSVIPIGIMPSEGHPPQETKPR